MFFHLTEHLSCFRAYLWAFFFKLASNNEWQALTENNNSGDFIWENCVFACFFAFFFLVWIGLSSIKGMSKYVNQAVTVILLVLASCRHSNQKIVAKMMMRPGLPSCRRREQNQIYCGYIYYEAETWFQREPVNTYYSGLCKPITNT